jgi:hypothetical protein
VNGVYQNLMQLMPFRVSRPRVFQILENLLKLLHGTASSALGAIRWNPSNPSRAIHFFKCDSPELLPHRYIHAHLAGVI